jgi:hypothetical protein
MNIGDIVLIDGKKFGQIVSFCTPIPATVACVLRRSSYDKQLEIAQIPMHALVVVEKSSFDERI